jgi:hypothetical protein
MKLATCSIAALTLLALSTKPVSAQTATQIIRFSVQVQQHAVVQEMPSAMSPRGKSAAVATGSYGFTANESNRKITASLDEAMPRGATLAVTMAAPAGARSAGETTLGTNAVDLVTAIPASQSSGLPVRYAVRAPDGLGDSEQRLVTYTVTAAP